MQWITCDLHCTVGARPTESVNHSQGDPQAGPAGQRKGAAVSQCQRRRWLGGLRTCSCQWGWERLPSRLACHSSAMHWHCLRDFYSTVL